METTLFTIEEIASTANTSVKRVRREIASGNLKSVKKRNRYYVQKEDFYKWNKSDCTNIETKVLNKNSYDVDIVNWVDVSEQMREIDGWHKQADLKPINFIDLFAGAGGLSCGLVMAGMQPVGSVEILPEAVKTYRRNFTKYHKFDANIETRDIREENVKKDLINSVRDKHIHLITGGFPCQGFSMAGNRIVDDERNSLYKEMLSIVKQIQPDFVLMENVEGLRSMLGGMVEKKIISDYAQIGYKINVTVLNSADYGVPQIRKRVIFIGNRINATNFHPKPLFSESKYKTVRDGIERFANIMESKENNHIFTKHSEKITNKLKELPAGESLYDNYSDAWKRVFWNKPSVTVKENHGGVNVHPLFPRVMTPRELAALQSFPDDFIFEGPKKWQLVQIGNAVPPLLAKAIGLAIRASINSIV